MVGWNFGLSVRRRIPQRTETGRPDLPRWQDGRVSRYGTGRNGGARLALDFGKPLYLMGGFGGATRIFGEAEESQPTGYWSGRQQSCKCRKSNDLIWVLDGVVHFLDLKSSGREVKVHLLLGVAKKIRPDLVPLTVLEKEQSRLVNKLGKLDNELVGSRRGALAVARGSSR